MLLDIQSLPTSPITPDAHELREQCLDALIRLGPLTPDEVAESLQVSLLSVRPRMSELRVAGLMQPTGATRPSKGTGAPQNIYSAVPGAMERLKEFGHRKPPTVKRGQAPAKFVRTSYVVGFLFDQEKRWVVLVHKEKPVWQKGKWNGVGGKVEKGETFVQAMTREFREEAGLTVLGWEAFAHHYGDDFEIQFFFAFGAAHAARTQPGEVERIGLHPVSDLPVRHLAPNAHWLIPLALTQDREDFLFPFVSKEVR